MKENPIKKLQEIRYSIWLDNLSRHLVQSGELKRLMTEGITGITSNPTIFQKAISGSKDYDSSLRALLAKGLRNEKEIFLGLAMEDITQAADLLRPVYQQSKGLDGYVSIEVSPDLAYDTEKTVAEAGQLFSTAGRKNVLVKVPATKPGVPAIKQLTAEGVNVNVTLLFSVNRYQEVAEAYLQGLEERSRRGMPIQEITSVASFFVSRVDTMIDPLLQSRLNSAAPGAEKTKIKGYLGKAAVANARLAYKKYREIFSGQRFKAIQGARIQRILWGSTGTKNPAYSDVKYVEELIGPDAINTLPEATLKAFLDHGQTQVTAGDHLAEAGRLFPELKSLGIDIDQVTAKLEEEGVKLFADSFFALLKEIAAKRDSFLK